MDALSLLLQDMHAQTRQAPAQAVLVHLKVAAVALVPWHALPAACCRHRVQRSGSRLCCLHCMRPTVLQAGAYLRPGGKCWQMHLCGLLADPWHVTAPLWQYGTVEVLKLGACLQQKDSGVADQSPTGPGCAIQRLLGIC